MASIRCGKCKSTHESVDQVKACYRQTAGPGHAGIPVGSGGRGYYALRDGRSGEVQFFVVVRLPEWTSGRTAVYRQAGDQHYRMVPTLSKIVLDQIAQNPDGSAKLYGDEMGRCSMCNRSLTTEESRAVGIGPVCLKRMRGAA